MTGTAVTENVARSCYERVMEKVEYEKLRASVDEFNRNNKWLKRGIGIVGAKGNMGFMESDDINIGLAFVRSVDHGPQQIAFVFAFLAPSHAHSNFPVCGMGVTGTGIR